MEESDYMPFPVEGQEERLLAQITASAAGALTNPAMARLQGVEELSPDLQSPVAPHASEISRQITGMLTTGTTVASSSTQRPMQTKQVIQEMAIKVAPSTGVLIEEVHIEDLFLISATSSTALTSRDIYMYFRGIARANQLSATTKLEKLVTSMEHVLTRNQQVLQSYADTSKLTTERLSLLSGKIDNIAPAVIGVVQAELKTTRAHITTQMAGVGKTLPAIKTSAGASTSSSPQSPTMPGIEEIHRMCTVMDCNDSVANQIANTYVGIATWADYEAVGSGRLDLSGFKAMIGVWKKIYIQTKGIS
ncbi:TPA_asm: P [Rhopalocnemis gammacytorhabdovirus 1]|nr:TPA_asm: P [Rhopalocnemis gammacytorhabdovirus 1]